MDRLCLPSDLCTKAVQNCKSFDDGNKLSELLPLIDRLSNDQVEKLIQAFNENSQIRDSYGFSGKNPKYFGDGLVHHLQRITKSEFKLSPSGNIIR